MNRLVFAVSVALAACAGYLVGRAGPERGTRADGRAAYATGRPSRRVIEFPAEELVVLRRDAQRVPELEAANRQLRERIAELDPAAGDAEPAVDLPLGTRRPDGSIVGGARWSPMTRAIALGFLDTLMSDFIREAELTEDQKQRLKAELEKRIAEGMQSAADFVNGDITSDEAYEQLQTMVAESRKFVNGTLDARQIEIYRKFEGGTVEFVHGNVVNNEMAALRGRLSLDAEQAKHIRSIVETRYRRVQEKLHAPIPNMFFRPVRRDSDAPIYDETAASIREYLRPDQVAAFDAYEAGANTGLQEYRSLLVPKGP